MICNDFSSRTLEQIGKVNQEASLPGKWLLKEKVVLLLLKSEVLVLAS